MSKESAFYHLNRFEETRDPTETGERRLYRVEVTEILPDPHSGGRVRQATVDVWGISEGDAKHRAKEVTGAVGGAMYRIL